MSCSITAIPFLGADTLEGVVTKREAIVAEWNFMSPDVVVSEGVLEIGPPVSGRTTIRQYELFEEEHH